MNNCIIKQGKGSDLDLVKPLWEKLNQLHSEVSPYFKKRFLQMSWEKRKSKLLKKSGEILLEYVLDSGENRIIGYCITIIDKEDKTAGEIESIFIEENYRKTGIGRKLIGNALEWLTTKGANVQKVVVAAGNESVMDYYRQFDFFPLHIVLQRIEQK